VWGTKRTGPLTDDDSLRDAKKRKIDTLLLEEKFNTENEFYKVKNEIFTKFDSEHLQERLNSVGLEIHQMNADGNCLFRSVADQIYGDPEKHELVRSLCMDFMEKERDHYSQFVTEDFEDYVNRKKKNKCHGNHLELQAIAELYNRAVEIYTYDENSLNLFHELYTTDNPPIRISYHHGNHYNSVKDPSNPTTGAGLGLKNYLPGLTPEEVFVEQAKTESDITLIEDQMIMNKVENSDMEHVESEILTQAILESKKDFIDEDEMLNRVLAESRMEYDDEDECILEILMRSQFQHDNDMEEEAIRRSMMEY